MALYQQFRFVSYRFDLEKKLLTLNYGLDDKISFTETFSFNFDFAPDINQEALDRACFGLFMMAGASYYKTYLPETIVIEQGSLNVDQAAFFDTVYRNGLGELYARNQITPPSRIGFPVKGESAHPVKVDGLSGALVPIGGGKDSLVSVELLSAAGVEFDTWMVNQADLLKPLLQRIGGRHLQLERQMDPQLSKLNQEGAYNGHVPISSILAFAAVVSALLDGKQDVVLSNEASAGEGNLEYHGLEVNHQYSKTLGFERLFQEYVKNQITESVNYFSLLRPFSELRIAELFCARWLGEYRGVFTSCNRNFKQGNAQPLSWCGKCAKCAFVYLIFSPFVPKADLVSLFGGKSLFEDPDLDATYRELLGIQGHKPFDCVGEIRECRQAVVMALATGEYPELARFKFPEFEFDYRQMGESAMPSDYLEMVKQLAA